MDQAVHTSPTQTIADAIIDGASLVEAGRIVGLARQGLEEPASLTRAQARQVFAAFLLLNDPLVRPSGEGRPTSPWRVRASDAANLHEMPEALEIAPILAVVEAGTA